MEMPLAGVRVVALEQAVAAPFCSRQLADMGADVVKVERPDGGDFARSYDTAIAGQSAYFVWLNRGKRSIVLDLKSEPDKAVLAKLLARADIFVHNLAPGAVERLGFGYEALASAHPRLVWCGISGYGPDGPYRDKKAYDMLVQGEAGIISLTGSEQEPAKAGVSMADIASGLYAYSSILAALLQRERSGRGQRIDISMLECLTEWMMPPLYTWLGAGRAPARAGARHNMIVPYGVYRCADGAVNFSIQNEREWIRFCEHVMADAALAADARFCNIPARLENRIVLEAAIEGRFAALTQAQVIALLDAAGIANGAVNDVPAVAQHPQLEARGRWTSAATPLGPVPALLPPHNLADAQLPPGRVPALGEHTAEILRELD
jgi:crotonobetainyl-CoA:carnitine CoA-transferase CaiB-like acyl-CoA transferase